MFGGRFCQKEKVSRQIAAAAQVPVIGDAEIVRAAAQQSGWDARQIRRAFSADASVFDPVTREKEAATAHLRQALADRLNDAPLVIRGNTALLVPRAVSHCLRVCLVAGRHHRVRVAADAGVPEKTAIETIIRTDADKAAWVRSRFNVSDPWDPSLFDRVIAMDRQPPAAAVATIVQAAARSGRRPTPSSKQAVADFRLAARIESLLVAHGHPVAVAVRKGDVTLTVNRHAMARRRLAADLREIVAAVAGVNRVAVTFRTNDSSAPVYRQIHFTSRARVLLVDDESEFVTTLAERLMLRDICVAVVHNGHSALAVIEKDKPEIIIVDLKMPGIGGMEVLRRVRKTRPETAVIVLTGHGSDKDREVCLNMGAFAYLQKPVEIEALTRVIRQAGDAVRAR